MGASLPQTEPGSLWISNGRKGPRGIRDRRWRLLNSRAKFYRPTDTILEILNFGEHDGAAAARCHVTRNDRSADAHAGFNDPIVGVVRLEGSGSPAEQLTVEVRAVMRVLQLQLEPHHRGGSSSIASSRMHPLLFHARRRDSRHALHDSDALSDDAHLAGVVEALAVLCTHSRFELWSARPMSSRRR